MNNGNLSFVFPQNVPCINMRRKIIFVNILSPLRSEWIFFSTFNRILKNWNFHSILLETFKRFQNFCFTFSPFSTQNKFESKTINANDKFYNVQISRVLNYIAIYRLLWLLFKFEVTSNEFISSNRLFKIYLHDRIN